LCWRGARRCVEVVCASFAAQLFLICFVVEAVAVAEDGDVVV